MDSIYANCKGNKIMRNIYEELLFTNEEIVKRSKELGKEISKDYENKNPLLVGLLKGSIPFMAELIKHITCDMEIDFMQASSYEGTESTLNVKIKKDLEQDITNRHILIVEDIVDTGFTLKKVLEILKDRGAASVEVVSLLNKQENRVVDVTAKYVGYEIPNKFVVGFGLDYNEQYRNTDDIGVLKKEIYMK